MIAVFSAIVKFDEFMKVLADRRRLVWEYNGLEESDKKEWDIGSECNYVSEDWSLITLEERLDDMAQKLSSKSMRIMII